MRDAGRDLVMLMYQTSSHGFYVGTVENPPEVIAQAQLDMALNDPLIDMWGPSYMGLPANHTIGQGNVHHNAHGYRLMGLYAQKALRHRLLTRTADKPDGEKYLPVHATRARKLNSRTVITDVFTYHPPLVIDDSYITELVLMVIMVSNYMMKPGGLILRPWRLSRVQKLKSYRKQISETGHLWRLPGRRITEGKLQATDISNGFSGEKLGCEQPFMIQILKRPI
ncbi:hypothetical protein QYS46_11730 [Klebsiella michiganensis]|nr:hypothetical protein [Klebsiella michiganensis]